LLLDVLLWKYGKLKNTKKPLWELLQRLFIWEWVENMYRKQLVKDLRRKPAVKPPATLCGMLA